MPRDTRWRQQPPSNVPVDKAHPLLKGCATHVFVGDHRENKITGIAPTWYDTARPIAWTNKGLGADFYNGGSGTDHYSPTPNDTTNTPWTMAAIVWNAAVGVDSTYAIHTGSRGSSDGDRVMYVQADNAYCSWLFSGGAVFAKSSAGVAVVGRAQIVVASASSTHFAIWVDGVKGPTTTTLFGTTGRLNSGSVLSVGHGYGPTDKANQQIPLFIRVYGRAWGDGEVQDFTANPWQIFQPRRRVLFGVTAAGGSFNAAWAQGANAIVQPGALQ